jgi:tellurite resistance protein
MSDGAPRILDERRQALEEAFFRKQDEALRARIQTEREHESAREALAAHSPGADAALLDRLVELGIRVDSLAALMLVPLVEVAWADGTMDPREREAVLNAAAVSGVEPGSPSHALLENWTEQRPPAALYESWNVYVSSLCRELSADHRWHLEEQLIGRARSVARAAGGFLGLAKVSKPEEEVLARLEQAFGVG